MKTIAISLDAALLISRMLPQASTMNIAAMQATSELLSAILAAPEEPLTMDDTDDGLGDRAGR